MYIFLEICTKNNYQIDQKIKILENVDIFVHMDKKGDPRKVLLLECWYFRRNGETIFFQSDLYKTLIFSKCWLSEMWAKTIISVILKYHLFGRNVNIKRVMSKERFYIVIIKNRLFGRNLDIKRIMVKRTILQNDLKIMYLFWNFDIKRVMAKKNFL